MQHVLHTLGGAQYVLVSVWMHCVGATCVGSVHPSKFTSLHCVFGIGSSRWTDGN